MLMDHTDTGANRIGGRSPRSSYAVHGHATSIRANHAECDSHERGLPSAVLTKQGVHRSWSNRDACTVQGHHSPESLANPGEFESERGWCQCRVSGEIQTLL